MAEKAANKNRVNLLVIGAGPTGLGAALRWYERSRSGCLVLEAGSAVGGLASSFIDDKGFTWDLGTHVQFSHYEKYDEMLDRALGQDGWVRHRRSAWTWLRGQFVPYPFQSNVQRLPKHEKWECVRGLLRAWQQPSRSANDFREWILNTFGEGIAEQFMFPYNEKLWNVPLQEMSHEWVGQRVARPDLETVLENVCLETDSTSWGANSDFRYPQVGGTGAIWQAAARMLPEGVVRFGERVVSIDTSRRSVKSSRGNTFGYDSLLTSVPLDALGRILRGGTSIAQTEKLAHAQTHVVGIGLSGQVPQRLREKSWVYFPEQSVPFYRVTVLSNLSERNTPAPGKTWSLLAEVGESHSRPSNPDDVIRSVVDGVRQVHLIPSVNRVASCWHHSVGHSYPVPTLDRDHVLDEVMPQLQRLGIYSRGRFGAWRYEVGNQDHSFMQGVEVVEHLLSGKTEITIRQPDIVNGRHNPFPFREWCAQPCVPGT